MAWTGFQDFNEASDGALDGNSSGTGWSIAWGGAGTVKLNESEFKVDTTAVLEGTRSVHIDCASASAYIQRLITTAATAGTVAFKIRAAQTDKVCIYSLGEGSANRMLVEFASDGNIKFYNNTGASYETIQAYSANTWYLVRIDFDSVAQANKYRVSIDGGTYSNYREVNGGTYTNINQFGIEQVNSSGADFFLDYLTGSTQYAQSTSVSDTLTLSDFAKYGHIISFTETVTLSDYQDTGVGFSNQSESSSTWTLQSKS